MSDTTVTPIKLNEAELQEIHALQAKIQQAVTKFGHFHIEKMELDKANANYVIAEKTLKDEWNTLQANEKEILNKILSSYGEGNLSLLDGTFIPSVKK